VAGKEVPVGPSRTEGPTKTGQLGEQDKWHAVLPQAIHLEPRTLLVVRAKVTDPQKKKTAPKSAITGWAHAELTELPLQGVYAARTIS
jgi:hypothetical protein